MVMLEILIAEDDSTSRLTVAEALREKGHRVQEAKDTAAVSAAMARFACFGSDDPQRSRTRDDQPSCDSRTSWCVPGSL
jgi:CheY-like chemotaxis protein